MRKINYSIVVPVYNSTASLVDLSMRINKIFSETIKSSYELIFVDDCSTNPDTSKILREITNTSPFVTTIFLSRNFGQQSATLCGISHSEGDYIITMDDDLQHLPEEIPFLIKEKQHDVVIGTFIERKNGFFDQFTSRIKSHFDKIIFDKPDNIQLTSFRLISRHVANGILHMRTPYPMFGPMMFSLTKDVVGAHVNHQPRHSGQSGYSFSKRLRVFTNLVINNSSFLLKSIGHIGILTALSSFIFGGWLIIRKLSADNIPMGWTSVTVILLFIGGLLLFSISIIGEYLLRIITIIEQKPMYYVKQTITSPLHPDPSSQKYNP